MAGMKLTEKKIRDLPYGSGIHRDSEVKGLMVLAHKTVKTYACQGDVRRNGRHVRTVRVKLDRCDRIGLAEARRKAKSIMSTIQSGIDPTAGKDETDITLAAAFDAHLNERELRPRSVEGYQYHLKHHLKKFRSRAVADISRQDVRELLDRLTNNHGRTTAASALRTLRAVINTARRIDETIGANPVDAVRVPVPPRREVDELDLHDFWKKTEKLTPVMRDLQRAFLLTGARRSSMLNVMRNDVDLENRVLKFSHMKTGGELLFPMGQRLADMLANRMQKDAPLNSPWLWPSSNSASGHIEEPKRSGIPSPHRLRHSARTLLIEAGAPYAESALLVGHRLPGATGAYVHQSHLVEALRPHAEALEYLVVSRIQVNQGNQLARKKL